MSPRRPIALAALLVLAAGPAAAELPDNLVGYRQVTWKDFRGTPSALGPEAAMINTGIHLEPFELEVEHVGGEAWKASAASPRVEAFMNPLGSGVRPGANTERALAHEQLHFDIAELYARKLAAELGGLVVEGDDPVGLRFDTEERLEEIRIRLLRELDATQARYDRDTYHGLRKGKQRQWVKEIALQLAAE